MKTFLGVLFLTAFALSANAAPVKNIVLVHGAWVDASGWKPGYEHLRREGFNVKMVQVQRSPRSPLRR